MSCRAWSTFARISAVMQTGGLLRDLTVRETVELTAALVDIESESRNESAIADAVEEALREQTIGFDVLRHGSSTIYKAFEGSATWSTTTSRRVGLGVTPSNSARKARVKYRVCSRTCSSWQTSRWYSV